MSEQKVEVRCQGAVTMLITDLEAFQGDLKKLTKDNYQKLKKLILKLGYSEPISVWKSDGKNYILNGHQRLRTLLQMQAEGYIVPPVPVNLVEAASRKEAKEKVLAMTSQFGDLDEDGLYEFATDAGLNGVDLLDGYRFSKGEFDTDKFVHDYYVDSPEEKKKEKTRKPVECPQCGHTF
jgi:hypothetical protein